MCINLSFGELNSNPYPSHTTNIYKITIALKVHSSYILKFLIKDDIFFFLMNIVVKAKALISICLEYRKHKYLFVVCVSK